MNKAQLTSELCTYAIHGKNANIIYLLEENKIKFDRCPFLMESIKCHHNEIADYIKNQMKDDVTNKQIFSSCLKYHNFIELFELIDKIGFDSFDKFDTLRLFIENDHTVFTKFYFTYKNDPKIKDEKYYKNILTLIQMAIKNGNAEIFDLFINDFDVNNKLFNEENETALHMAVKCGKYDIVK